MEYLNFIVVASLFGGREIFTRRFGAPVREPTDPAHRHSIPRRPVFVNISDFLFFLSDIRFTTTLTRFFVVLRVNYRFQLSVVTTDKILGRNLILGKDLIYSTYVVKDSM